MTIGNQGALALPLNVRRAAAVDSRARATSWKRNKFLVHPVPERGMSTRPVGAFPIPRDSAASPPQDLQPCVDWFYSQHEARERFRWALRDSLDELLDGQRTGRWCYQHLSKTEKTYLGTAVEVNLTKEFCIEAGVDLDWKVAGADLDCKFSRELGGWEIPMEMYRCADHGDQSGRADHPALLTWFSDDRSEWAAGLIRVTDQRLRWKKPDASGNSLRAYNRDYKRKIADDGLRDIFWLWGGIQDDLPTNHLLHLAPEQRGRILRDVSGQERVNQLFRELAGRVVSRHTVLTVAQQDDSPKRVRDARIALRPEGLVVLGAQEAHPAIARRLKLPVPAKGEWVSVRLAEVGRDADRPKFWLDHKWWAVAHSDEPIIPAPAIPRFKLPEQPN
ncbi:NaeI family type II restriction endonuclease [Amycolatopsis orientalis]|uniref:NaeI family type II restriction endonuclease n=1 Tax=Amycolatopsis orientalis TaxID=31958 RepID=UPI00191BCE53|nr:NaeI family type II restriction endonuclease [Amycolatopsis orientalis]